MEKHNVTNNKRHTGDSEAASKWKLDGLEVSNIAQLQLITTEGKKPNKLKQQKTPATTYSNMKLAGCLGPVLNDELYHIIRAVTL